MPDTEGATPRDFPTEKFGAIPRGLARIARAFGCNGPPGLPIGVAVGRKHHYGSRSKRGTRVAALFYSQIELAKLCGVEPRGYLREATLRAVRNPGTATLARDLKSTES